MEFHELANLFPMATPEELQALVVDIEANGLQEPIWVYDGKILDGRNRYTACEILGIDATYQEYTGDDPTGFSLSLNLIRRQLNVVQRAVLATSLLEYERIQAQRRQSAAGGADPGPLMENFPEAGTARDLAGAKVGVSGKYVDMAQSIKEERPDIFKRMYDGRIKSMSLALHCKNIPTENLDDAINEYVQAEQKAGKHAAMAVLRKLYGEKEKQAAAPGKLALTAFNKLFEVLPKITDEILLKQFREYLEDLLRLIGGESTLDS